MIVWIIYWVCFVLKASAEDTSELTPVIERVDYPKVVLYGFEFELDVILNWQKLDKRSEVYYSVKEGEEQRSARLIKQGKLVSDTDHEIQPQTNFNRGTMMNGYTIKGLTLSKEISRKVWVEIKTSLESEVIDSSNQIIHGMPGVVTLIPIIVMLGAAMVSNQATLALLLGIFISATFINGFNPFLGFLRTIDDYIISSLATPDHAKVIMFTFYLSATVALIQKSGGAEAMAISVTNLATTRWRGQWCSYIIGLIIFIDDLSSCMVVGANMRTVTDRLYLSHEKLAYIVHVTSPTITSLSPVSSWIGFMLGLISIQFTNLKITEEPFMFFIRTIPSRFFPIFAIIFCGVIMITRRDFGSMLVAERRAFFDKILVIEDNTIEELDDPLEPPVDAPRRLINSILPIFTVVLITVTGLLLSGYYVLVDQQGTFDEKQINIYTMAGAGDSYSALLYASLFSCIMCTIMYRIQNIISFKLAMTTIMYGVKDMVETMLILVFAWAVGQCFIDMNVSNFIISALNGNLNPGLIPVLCCILGSIMSFTTGTSWGTMAIILPLAMPLAHANRGNDDLLVVYTASAAFSGALFGDMCSPIAATTLLTCASVRIPVQHHVNTQLPYALVSLAVACLVGYLPLGFKTYPDYVALLIGTACLILCAFLFGVETESFTQSRWVQLKNLLLHSKSIHSMNHPTITTDDLDYHIHETSQLDTTEKA